MRNKPQRIRVSMALAGLGAGLLGPLAAFGQDSYPSRNINMVVPFPAGGGTDVVGRFIAEALSEVLPQRVIVLNKGGAAGVLGTQFVKAERPDGYHLLFTSQSIVTQTYETQGKSSHKDFIMIGMLNQDAFGLAVAQNAKWKSLKEFIDDAKANPGAMTVGTTGVGSATYTQIPLLEKAAGIKLNAIPYPGSAGFHTAVLGGTVNAAGVVVGDAAQLLKSGQLRMLGILSPQRLEQFPDVPTYKEMGINVDFIFWRGLFVHKDTPGPVVATLRQAVAKVANSAAFKERMIKANFIPAAMTQEGDLTAFVRKEEMLTEEVLRSVGKL